MLPEDYVIKLGTDSCTLLITVNEDFWALGMTVMRGYYVIFDVQNDQVGFVPQNDSKKTAIAQDVASSTSPTPLV